MDAGEGEEEKPNRTWQVLVGLLVIAGPLSPPGLLHSVFDHSFIQIRTRHLGYVGRLCRGGTVCRDGGELQQNLPHRLSQQLMVGLTSKPQEPFCPALFAPPCSLKLVHILLFRLAGKSSVFLSTHSLFVREDF